MIEKKDFIPEITEKGGMFKSTKMEQFNAVVQHMNDWIKENDPQIVNVETVVLPNIFDPSEEGSEDTMLGVGGQSLSNWYQFIRVWYKS
ncbi:MAG: hypothetical protein AAF789_11415 [Bacteroidota bacterium]